MTCFRSRYALAMLAALTVTLAACGDSNSPSTGLSDAQATDIGATFRDEIESGVAGLSVAGSTNPLNASIAPAAAFNPPPLCVAIAGAGDSDGDGVPDDATFTFNSCSKSGIRGGTLTLGGQLRIQDPTPNVAGFPYVGTATDFTLSFDAGGTSNDYTAVRNGLRTLTGAAAGLTLDDSARVTRIFAGSNTATVVRKWTLSFTPVAGSALQINQPLPAGDITVAGTAHWTRGAESFDIQMQTASPLRYDASCDNVQKITSGELRATGQFNNEQGYVRITWSGCGSSANFKYVRAQ